MCIRDRHQGIGIGEAKSHADCVDKECIESHARCLPQGQVGQQSNQDRSHNSGDGGCDVDGIVGNTVKLCKHTSVDHQNVGHCHEGGKTCHDLRSDGGAALLDFEKLIQINSPLSFSIVLLFYRI